MRVGRFFGAALLATPLWCVLASGLAANSTQFIDVTAAAGVKFRHNSGAVGKKYLPETMGAGVAFLDADGDGWQDLLFVQSADWPGQKRTKSVPALYRNNKNGTFTDVTQSSGLAVETYGIGAAAADYDNDGDIDIYLTALGPNRLLRNTGGGKFEDVTAKAGVGDPGFSTSAMWFDYDRDGHLDLFVANYVEWTPKTDIFCSLDGKTKSYCTPESYKGQSPTLYRNKGDATFENVTKKAGIYDPTNKMLGLALIDYNNDGWPDVVAANDTQPNRLYHNNGNGTFKDVAMTAGIAFNEAGVARAGMGVDAADYDNSGRQSVVIGNFSNEMIALYSNEGNGLFIDEAPGSTIGKVSMLTLTFAAFFFDYDLDGMVDIFAANGHVADDINKVQKNVTYEQAPHLFRNLGSKKFDAVGPQLGAPFKQPVVARGAAYGDYDNDGDLDIAITANNGPARLLRNSGGTNNALRVSTLGTTSNRNGIGTKVRVTVDGGTARWSVVKTGSSYCSQSELPLTFGLGTATKVSRIEVTWPNGKTETLPGVGANQTITIQEGKGIIRTVPLAAKNK